MTTTGLRSTTPPPGPPWLDDAPTPDELPGGQAYADLWTEAERRGDRHWRMATSEERIRIVRDAAISRRRQREQAERLGYPSIEAYLEATDDLQRELGQDERLRSNGWHEVPIVDHRTIQKRLGVRSLDEISTDPPPPLLLDRLDPAGHTVLYGTGGVGKGTITAWWIAQLNAAGQRVLILDYENHPEEWARRHWGLIGADGIDDVLHVSPLTAAWTAERGALWRQENEVRALVEDAGVTYLVIDSIVPACGGADPVDPGTVARYTAALEFIGRPALSLGHVPKNGGLEYPYGSAFWHNLARVTWSLAKDGERVQLVNRKANNYARAGRFIVETTWHEGRPAEVRELSYTAVLADRIDEALAAPATVAQITARLNEDRDEGEASIKDDSVRAALRRGIASTARSPQRFAVDGTGSSALWRRVEP